MAKIKPAAVELDQFNPLVVETCRKNGIATIIDTRKIVDDAANFKENLKSGVEIEPLVQRWLTLKGVAVITTKPIIVGIENYDDQLMHLEKMMPECLGKLAQESNTIQEEKPIKLDENVEGMREAQA